MGMVPEERICFLDHFWGEETSDPETWEWRDELDAEELALVESWDRAYVQGVGTLAEDILAGSEEVRK